MSNEMQLQVASDRLDGNVSVASNDTTLLPPPTKFFRQSKTQRSFKHISSFQLDHVSADFPEALGEIATFSALSVLPPSKFFRRLPITSKDCGKASPSYVDRQLTLEFIVAYKAAVAQTLDEL